MEMWWRPPFKARAPIVLSGVRSTLTDDNNRLIILLKHILFPDNFKMWLQ